MSRPKSYIDLRERANDIIGIPFSEIDKTGRLSTGKGGVGTMIEESWFGQKPHSDKQPDFPELGVELKVTPYTIKKGNYRSKERLVCNMIDYMSEYKANNFEQSSFYLKCSNLLLLFYEHDFSKENYDFDISHIKFLTLDPKTKEKHAFYFLLPEEDIEIMRQDWKKIVNKIKEGKAHEISEGDTNYLGACTKAANSRVRVEQPFSENPAKPRAFSIKQSYMTYVLNNYVINNYTNEKLIEKPTLLKEKNFEDIIIEKIKPYFGQSDEDLAHRFGIDVKNKSYRERIVAKILGISGKVNDAEEFQKASITCKTIRVEPNGKIKESMSFSKIDFLNLVDEEWDDSEFYKQIGLSRFMFVIFKRNNGQYVLSNVKFWNMPEKDLVEAEKVWLETQSLVKNDQLIIGGKYGYSVENFPKSSANSVAHVRPHDRDLKEGRTPLPSGQKIANYCFWLNRKYVKKIIND